MKRYLIHIIADKILHSRMWNQKDVDLIREFRSHIRKVTLFILNYLIEFNRISPSCSSLTWTDVENKMAK
jgi:hypothetical protein